MSAVFQLLQYFSSTNSMCRSILIIRNILSKMCGILMINFNYFANLCLKTILDKNQCTFLFQSPLPTVNVDQRVNTSELAQRHLSYISNIDPWRGGGGKSRMDVTYLYILYVDFPENCFDCKSALIFCPGLSLRKAKSDH